MDRKFSIWAKAFVASVEKEAVSTISMGAFVYDKKIKIHLVLWSNLMALVKEISAEVELESTF